MRGLIDQRALIVLAVDFHQLAADLAQHLHAHRLVVDERARAPVSQLHAAQDQLAFVVDIEIVGFQHRERRVILFHVERRDHLPMLGALAHQRRVAAAAERERERVEHDRLARAGLPGQHREPRGEIEIELLDEDDVANRKMGQHGRLQV